MESVKLEAKKRSGVKPNAVRARGAIPAVLYGHGVENTTLELAARDFSKLYREIGMSTLIDLTIDGGAPTKVVVHDIQMDPMTEAIVHVDFRALDMQKEMELTVPIVFVGIPPAVKQLGGVLLRQMNEVSIQCLPSVLVHELTVDLSGLNELGMVLHASDIPIPEGITLTENPERVVISVKAPRVEVETVATAGEAVGDVGAVEVEKKGKDDDESGEAKEEETKKDAS